jgi:hypothetical protein
MGNRPSFDKLGGALMGQGSSWGGSDDRPWRWDRMSAEERLKASMEMCESPIEQLLLKALMTYWPTVAPRRDFKKALVNSDNDIETAIFPQYQFGPHRVDFAIMHRWDLGREPVFVVVECDGRAFHDRGKDQARDAYLKENFAIHEIVRLSGALITVDVKEAAGMAHDAFLRMTKTLSQPPLAAPPPRLIDPPRLLSEAIDVERFGVIMDCLMVVDDECELALEAAETAPQAVTLIDAARFGLIGQSLIKAIEASRGAQNAAEANDCVLVRMHLHNLVRSIRAAWEKVRPYDDTTVRLHLGLIVGSLRAACLTAGELGTEGMESTYE